jgi:hypothetical protein
LARSKEITEKEITRRKGIRKTLSLIASLTGVPSNGKDRRGFAAEEKAFQAALFWKRKKLIRAVRKTQRLSSEDRSMRDLVLTLLHGEETMVQVKNYCDFLVVKKCRDGGVLPFIIWQDEGEGIARERMLNLIFAAYVSELTPYQLRGIVAKILEAKSSPRPARFNLMERLSSLFGKRVSIHLF